MEFITEFTEQFESFVGVNFWTMIFAWVNILILYLFRKKILFKPVKNMIDSRQREIDDLYADSETPDATADGIYTIEGRRVQADNATLKPGIYIVNGRKVVR